MNMSLSCPCVCVCVSAFTARIGYRLKASPDQDSMKVLYYIEKELAQFPSTETDAYKRKPAAIRPVSVLRVFMCEHGVCVNEPVLVFISSSPLCHNI